MDRRKEWLFFWVTGVGSVCCVEGIKNQNLVQKLVCFISGLLILAVRFSGFPSCNPLVEVMRAPPKLNQTDLS